MEAEILAVVGWFVAVVGAILLVGTWSDLRKQRNREPGPLSGAIPGRSHVCHEMDDLIVAGPRSKCPYCSPKVLAERTIAEMMNCCGLSRSEAERLMNAPKRHRHG